MKAIWKLLIETPDGVGVGLAFLILECSNPHLKGAPGPFGWLCDHWAVVFNILATAAIAWAGIEIQGSQIMTLVRRIRPLYGLPRKWVPKTVLLIVFVMGSLLVAAEAPPAWRYMLQFTILALLASCYLEWAPRRLFYYYRVSKRLGHNKQAAVCYRLYALKWSYSIFLLLLMGTLVYLGSIGAPGILPVLIIVETFAGLFAFIFCWLAFRTFKSEGLYDGCINVPELELTLDAETRNEEP